MAGTRTLYVVTHPESRHHVEGRVGGWFDSPLTERGRSQARSIAAELRRRIPTDASAEVFTSDLARTRETAEVVAEALGTRAEVAAGLREKSYGVAEGREQAWLDERFVFPPKPVDVSPKPDDVSGGERMLDHQARLDHDEGIEGAETRRELGARVYAAMDEILARPAGHQVVVTHGFAHTFVIGRWLELPLEAMGWAAFAARSGCITELTEDAVFGNRTLRRLADVDHLGES
ncbi:MULTISPECIES: histidine phosphatase family protein [unclassified Brevibacterium]|uniref:histidine phosphatase family protein n=1 Tax=unclassified Brevibacterium TaxID=2614124 RepID=UPI001092F24B|nr:histidine phosphatase family protein [Brevibacterium sp. S22]TGD30609.1 histidine phosphatase family protein [Brevibacterium sp. S22]